MQETCRVLSQTQTHQQIVDQEVLLLFILLHHYDKKYHNITGIDCPSALPQNNDESLYYFKTLNWDKFPTVAFGHELHHLYVCV